MKRRPLIPVTPFYGRPTSVFGYPIERGEDGVVLQCIEHPRRKAVLTIEVYEEATKPTQWRWRAKKYVSGRWKVIFVSSEGYNRRGTMIRVMENCIMNIVSGKYKIVNAERPVRPSEAKKKG
jgi:hypothetical protein